MSNDADELGRALLARAEALAAEYRAAAQQRRAQMLAESAQHLALREEREVLAAKAAAERALRQQVQAAEIRLQAEYDRLRWTLVQSVLTQLDERVAQLTEDSAAYLPLLKSLIAAGADTLPQQELVVELNARDLARLSGQWPTLSAELAPGKTLLLGHEPLPVSGGALLHDIDNRVRVDHTFEGRKARLHDALAQAVMERLFAGAAHG